MSFTPHVDIDDKGVYRLGCMLCNDTIGTRDYVMDQEGHFILDAKGNKIPYLRHWSHIRFVEMHLSDGSFTDLLVCKDCAPRVNETWHEHLANTMKRAWLMEAAKTRPSHVKTQEDVKQRVLLTAQNHNDLKCVRKGRTHDIGSRLTRTWPHTA